MKTIAIILNIVLFGFIVLVLVTDGPPKQAVYVAFAIWWLWTLALSAGVISRTGPSRIMRTVTAIANIVFLGLIGWALVDQYPHPNEAGFIPFVILMLLTPVLNLALLFFRRAREARAEKAVQA